MTAATVRASIRDHLARRLGSHVSILALLGVLLVGLDSSQPARAVANAPTAHQSREQLVSPSVLVDSPVIVDRLVKPDLHETPIPIPYEFTVESGDTLIGLLARTGVVMSDAYAAVSALDGVFRARDVRPGWTLRVTLLPQDPPLLATLQSVSFQPSVERDVEISREADDGGFVAVTIPHPLHRVASLSSGTIDNGLFNTAMANGVPRDVLVEAIALFSFDVDFQRDLRVGDTFELFYDTLNNEQGEVARTGELYYAQLVLRGKERRYYRFTPHSGISDMFSPDGRSIRKALLQTPVDATRISSNFGMRRHPILGYSKMHRGVDFAAPAGTPVRAAGEGVVVAAGAAGSYGNYVRIRHNAKYGTAYAHLNGFASGIRKGAHVHQGQVIAYVGSTGRATGPHLHYEVLVDGAQVNPRGVRLPSGEQLAGEDLRAFKARQQQIDAMRASHQIGGGATIADSTAPGCDVSPGPVPALAVSLQSGC